MTDRQLLALAAKTLTDLELRVWMAKHYQGHGLHTGSRIVGITINRWRYTLHRAEAKMERAIQEAA